MLGTDVSLLRDAVCLPASLDMCIHCMLIHESHQTNSCVCWHALVLRKDKYEGTEKYLYDEKDVTKLTMRVTDLEEEDIEGDGAHDSRFDAGAWLANTGEITGVDNLPVDEDKTSPKLEQYPQLEETSLSERVAKYKFACVAKKKAYIDCLKRLEKDGVAGHVTTDCFSRAVYCVLKSRLSKHVRVLCVSLVLWDCY